MSALRLSVLDQSPIAHGSTGPDALRNTLDLADLAEARGFHRYWVAEHHGGPTLAGAAPEVLAATIAARTRGLRVGSGGVMLPHYSPLKVAEVWSTLAGLHPGRIDLGIGRASGTDAMTTFALQRDRSRAMPDDFPDQLAELLAHLEGTVPSDHPFHRLPDTLPGRPEAPEPWLLGSSPQSAIWAADLGLPYAFADFINDAGAPIAQDYVRRFADTARRPAAEVAVAAWVLVADSDEEAEHLALSSRMTLSLLRRGELIAVPPPDTAANWFAARADRRSGPNRRTIVGSPETVRPRIEQLAHDYGASEVIVVTITYDHAARRRSYELLADVFGLPGRQAGDVTPAAAA